MGTDGPPGAPGAVNPYAPPGTSIEAAAAPVPAGGEAYKSARGLANAIGILMGLDVLAALAVGVSSFLTIGVMRRAAAGEVAIQTALKQALIRFTGVAVFGLLVVVASIVLFCLFMARANRNARAFGSPMSMTPGWAAGWFFVPVAFWWKPYEAMKEIWQGSDPDPRVSPLQSRVSPLLPWWWCFYLLRNLGGIATRFIGNGENPAARLADLCQAQLVVLAPSVVAAILAAAVVRAVARRQDERQRRQPAVTAGAAP